MRRIAYALFLLLSALPSPAQTVTVTANNILGLNGNPLAQGYLCFTPVSAIGKAQAFTSNGKQYYAVQQCWRVLAGVAAGVTVPDTSQTSPAVGYMPVIEDTGYHPIQSYSAPFYPTAASYSFDTWIPSSNPVPLGPGLTNFGSTAPTTRCTSPSFGYLDDGTLYRCGSDQQWHAMTGGGTVTASNIAAALGYTPVSPAGLSGAIASVPTVTSANIVAALGYTPASQTALNNAIAAVPPINSTNIIAALGYAPVTPTQLTNAVSGVSPTVSSSSIITALGYTPVSPTDLSSAIATIPAVNAAYIASVLGYAPANPANVCALSGCTMTGGLILSDASPAASQKWVTAAITAALGGSGGGGTGGAGNPGTNIGTVNRTGIMTDGSIAFKTCYVGGSVCSGGVGDNPPTSAPQRVAGLNTPSAGTGTANAVASHTFSTQYQKVGNCYYTDNTGHVVFGASSSCFTDVLWTTTNGGLGTDSTSTNWYRDFWMKAAFPAGSTHFEFDTYSFNDGWDWMWGTQCHASKKIIQYDNQGNGWVDTPIPCAVLFDGNWHHIQQTFHRDLAATHNCAGGTAPCEWWDDIVIDGVTYVIGKSLPATTTTWTSCGGQIQLDTSPTTASVSSPATATVYIDTDIVTAGTAPDNGGDNPGGNGGGTAGTGELDSFNFDAGTPTSAGLTAVGSPAISTSNFHSAPNSIALPSGNNYYTDVLSAPTNVLYTRQYIYVSTVSTSSVMGVLRFYHGGAELWVYYLGQTSGTVTGVNQATGVTAGGGTLSAGAVHLVETYTKISATAGQYIIKVDGTVTYTSASNLNTGTSTIDTVWFGSIANTPPTGWGTTYMDNVDFSATGWIGPI